MIKNTDTNLCTSLKFILVAKYYKQLYYVIFLFNICIAIDVTHLSLSGYGLTDMFNTFHHVKLVWILPQRVALHVGTRVEIQTDVLARV